MTEPKFSPGPLLYAFDIYATVKELIKIDDEWRKAVKREAEHGGPLEIKEVIEHEKRMRALIERARKIVGKVEGKDV